MADVAYASGPASPKPSDIAPQQVSRADAPDRGKLRVFISYSREDLDFADQLNAAPTSVQQTFTDRHGLTEKLCSCALCRPLTEERWGCVCQRGGAAKRMTKATGFD